MAIQKINIISIPIFKLAFETNRYQNHLDLYTELVNNGSKIPTTEIIKILLQEYIKNIGISLSHRTIYFDFAWAVLENSPELWNEEEKVSGFCQLTNHIHEYFSDYEDAINDDVTILDTGEYFSIGWGLLNDEINQSPLKEAFSYAMYIFFKNWDYPEWEDLAEFFKNDESQ